MRHARLIELRRHDPDVVGQRAGDLLDDLQARRMDAVVICAEDSHSLSAPFRSIPPALGAVLSGYGDRGKPGRSSRNDHLGLYPAGVVCDIGHTSGNSWGAKCAASAAVA